MQHSTYKHDKRELGYSACSGAAQCALGPTAANLNAQGHPCTETDRREASEGQRRMQGQPKRIQERAPHSDAPDGASSPIRAAGA